MTASRRATLALLVLSLLACEGRAPSGRLASGPLATPEAPAAEVPTLEARWVGEADGDAPLLVLFHGYGAPGDDLVPFAQQIHAELGAPIRVAALAAPIAMGPGARAWWNITPGPRPADRGDEAPDGLVSARRAVEAWLAQQRFDPETTVVAGFSQGAMLSAELGLRGEPRLGAIAMLSGGPLDETAWRAAARRRPPEAVFISHGRRDPMLAYAASERLADLFRDASVPVTYVPFVGGHAIPPAVRARLVSWLRAWVRGERG